MQVNSKPITLENTKINGGFRAEKQRLNRGESDMLVWLTKK